MENQNLQPQRERMAAVDGVEEDEEMKMETFFALVRNFKEMRDRRRKELMIGDETEAVAKKRKTTEKIQNRSTWIPRFEREDFDEDFQVRGPSSLVLPKPCILNKEEATATKKKKKRMNSEDDCLDLNLAL